MTASGLSVESVAQVVPAIGQLINIVLMSVQ